MVGRDHPLYDSPTPLTAAQVADLDFALLTADCATRTCIDGYFARAGITPRVVIEVNSVATLLEVIRHTPVATLLPEPIATRDRGLHTFALTDTAPQRGASLLRRKNNYHSAASVAFMALVLGRMAD